LLANAFEAHTFISHLSHIHVAYMHLRIRRHTHIAQMKQVVRTDAPTISPKYMVELLGERSSETKPGDYDII